MADIDYFDSRVLTGVINRRPVKYDIFGNMFRRQAPKATELFELHVVSRGVSMLPLHHQRRRGTMRSGARGVPRSRSRPRASARNACSKPPTCSSTPEARRPTTST